MGKNSKAGYYLRGLWRLWVPRWWLRLWGTKGRLMGYFDKLPSSQKSALARRLDYYCKPQRPQALPPHCPTLGDHRFFGKNGRLAEGKKLFEGGEKVRKYPSVYFFDTHQFTRHFPSSLRWRMVPGDITGIPAIPSIVKSRPILGDNQNSVLLNLDKVRHFVFFADPVPFEEKLDRAIFRGVVQHKANRLDFMEKFIDHPLVDCGIVDRNPAVGHPHWHKPKISLVDHCRYKFIVALEGNDVASNLKWVMHSGSIAVMPRPRYETWFMEGLLEPGVHYIEVAPDFSDLVWQLEHYSARPELCRSIIANANLWVRQFRDPRSEAALSVKVLERYFSQTGNP